MGLRIDKSHIAVDRAKNFVFALAVENCVNRQVFAASLRPSDALTELLALSKLDEAPDRQRDVVQNDSIISVWLGTMFSIRDFIAMNVGEGKFMPITDHQTVPQRGPIS